jgi:zinc protease
VLDNGLTLIVHQDHKAPVVAVNVWYDVGSADEKEGKTGFAHLFEHLMFNGSENYDDDYFKAFDKVGVTGINGTTNFDRTNYFQVVPTTALDMALWMESDRMGHLLGAVDQGKLDEQRGVVQNEKRQGENQPYGKVFLTLFENTYPAGHPYDHSVIGSMEDLDAATWTTSRSGSAPIRADQRGAGGRRRRRARGRAAARRALLRRYPARPAAGQAGGRRRPRNEPSRT